MKIYLIGLELVGMKWRSVFGVLCDQCLSWWLKKEFHWATIKSAMLYHADYWIIKKVQDNKNEIANMDIW